MYIKDLIKSIELCKDLYNERDYRKVIAKAICIAKSQEYSTYTEIQFQTNVELLKRNLKLVSYNFVKMTLQNSTPYVKK